MAANPPCTIAPITAADVPTLAAHLHESKLALTINRLLWKDWPNDKCQKPQYTNAIEGSFKAATSENPLTFMWKAVDEKGEIVGQLVICHQKPAMKSDEKGEEEKGEKPKIEGTNEAVLGRVIEFCKEVERFGNVEHIDITNISVPPVYRRRGIGSLLVKKVFEKAAETKLPIYFSSEPAAHDFFLAQGFKDDKFVDTDLSKFAGPYEGFGIFRFYGMKYEK